MNAPSHGTSMLKTWLVIFALAAMIVGKGLFSLFMVGNLGPPGWDYGAVKDVPSQSPYAVYQKLPYSQHVRGAKGE